ncbi:MAG: hypothetical protein R3E65_11555 [Steroidobacteraceae bacterium]
MRPALTLHEAAKESGSGDGTGLATADVGEIREGFLSASEYSSVNGMCQPRSPARPLATSSCASAASFANTPVWWLPSAT